MKKKFNVITILALLGLIVASSITLGKAFAYFSADSSVSGTITMGHLYIDDIEPSDTTSTGWNITNLQPNQSFGGSYSVDVTSDINYYTRILFKASVTPQAGSTHINGTGCGDYVTDDTDILNISIDGTATGTYQKSTTKTSDGYTAYYKLTPTTVESETTTETFNIDLKVYDWVGNGYCDYYMGATVSINMYVQVMQADYLEGNSIGDISSASDMHELWNEIVPPPILDVTEYSNFTFTVLSADDKTMSVKKTDTSITEANIPAQVKKEGEIYTVTQIANYGFSSCESLTSATIPNTITYIGEEAFKYCSSLTAINVDSGNTAYSSIDGTLFDKDATQLIACPAGKTGGYTIPNGVTSIGEYAFYHCTNLTSITIPHSVTSIGEWAFDGCKSLTAINVDSANTTYSSIDGVVFNKDATTLVHCPQGKSGSYTIPNSVTGIGARAFYFCVSLTSVTIPSSVTSIGSYAFGACTNLTSVVIENGVTSIGDCAFVGCGFPSIDIPNSVTSIGGNAFACAGLTSITIPSSVTSIGSSAFQACTGLTSVVIENGVTGIGVGMFYECTSLTSITIPSSVTSIRRGAFYECTNLTSVIFENTEGWHLDSTTGTSISVTNASGNALRLRSTSGNSWGYRGLYRA